MTILNFIPLLIWMLGLPLLYCLDNHWSPPPNPESKKAEDNAYALSFWLGLSFWFVLAVALTAKGT